MKSGFLLLVSILFFQLASKGQYTPLPPMDKAAYENFIQYLKNTAEEQDIPELATLADSMNYEEARRFLQAPQSFESRLKEKPQAEEKPKPNLPKLGIVMNLLLDYLSNLGGSGRETDIKAGYAFGLYAMFRLGEIYIMPELLYMHRVGKLNYDQYSNSVIKLNYLTLIATLLHVFNTGNPRWYLGLGPIFSLGLSGKEELTTNGQTNKFDLEFGDNGIRQFHSGIAFRAGLIFSNSMMSYVGYNLMFTKVYSDSYWKMQSIVVGLTIPFSVFK